VLGGNIGQSFAWGARTLAAGGFMVAEISSFQLETTSAFRPHIAAILNITPDHLDRHGGFEGYVAAKALVFANQQYNDYLILNYEDAHLREFSKESKAKVCFFSSQRELSEGVYVKDGRLTLLWQGEEHKFCRVAEMKIFGSHNVENALAALAAGFFAGVPDAAISKVLTTFEGVEHRIEYVKEVAGVKYYNDSKATNPESSIKALEAFADGEVVLLAGGCDKMTDLTEFMQLAKRKTARLILLGAAKERFYAAAVAAGVANIEVVDSFEEAVEKAHAFAGAPQVVLLSPACSSYDMFNNFEERGRYFKKLVAGLL
jgi:UDP-N-acetylmuramoylalanine--D-glutamate ligase